MIQVPTPPAQLHTRRARRPPHAACGLLLLLVGATTLTGCINWGAAWEDSARRDCRSIPNTDDRQACLRRADEVMERNRRSPSPQDIPAGTPPSG
jgi:hypothetical protein